MNDKSIFSQRLSARRIELKYTQESFSKVVGMSRARYANYEQSRREPDFEIVKLFSDHLKISTDYLFGNSDHKDLLSEVLARNDKLQLTGKYAEAQQKLKAMLAEEQQTRLKNALEDFDGLSAESRQAILIMIKNLIR